MADTLDLGSSAERCAGSSPVSGTTSDITLPFPPLETGFFPSPSQMIKLHTQAPRDLLDSN